MVTVKLREHGAALLRRHQATTVDRCLAIAYGYRVSCFHRLALLIDYLTCLWGVVDEVWGVAGYASALGNQRWQSSAALDPPNPDIILMKLRRWVGVGTFTTDRKSTRLNSSHANISYAVFCLKKKKIS